MILKISQNNINQLSDLVSLKLLPLLIKLELKDNKICEIENYRKSVLEYLPNLQVLDGKNQDGESAYTEDEDDEIESYGEEGELDLDDQYGKVLHMLDPDQRARFLNNEMDEEEM